jgi:hypothetical protein
MDIYLPGGEALWIIGSSLLDLYWKWLAN